MTKFIVKSGETILDIIGVLVGVIVVLMVIASFKTSLYLLIGAAVLAISYVLIAFPIALLIDIRDQIKDKK